MSSAPNFSWRLSFFIARRYLFSRRHQHASFINWVSLVGLALGVMILTVVVSVMNGFDSELSRRILGAVPHAVVVPPEAGAELPPAVAEVAETARFFQGEAMLARRGIVNPVVVYGLRPEGAAAVRLITESMVEGQFEDLHGTDAGLVMGSPLARYMGLLVGDPVILIVSAPTANGVQPRIERFNLAGTFEIGAELDYTLAIVGFDDVADRGFLSSGMDGWRLTVADPLRIDAMQSEIAALLPVGWVFRTWAEDYGELFRAVKIEKAIMFVLLALIVAVAAFNIVSGQAMIVNDKRGDIAMLTTMGASRRLLVTVFLLQGFTIAALGVVIGLAAGIVIALNAGDVVAFIESFVGASIIDGTMYDIVPSKVLVSDLILIVLLSLGIAGAAVLRPALRAVADSPIEALHAG